MTDRTAREPDASDAAGADAAAAPADARAPTILAEYPSWGPGWLEAYKTAGTIGGACTMTRIPRGAVVRALERSAAFRTDWEDARESVADEYEGVVRDLAIKNRNLKAALAMLRAYRPQMFGPLVPRSADGPPPPSYDVQREALMAKLRARALPPGGPPPDEAGWPAAVSDEDVIDADYQGTA